MEEKDQGEKVIRTGCITQCTDICGVLAHVKDGVVTKIEPADFPESKYRYACRRALGLPKLVHHPDRLKYPMKRIGERGEGKWQRISWDEALDTIANKLKDIGERHGPESVAYLFGGFGIPCGARFIGQRFVSAVEGTFVTEYAAMVAAQFTADMLNFGKQAGASPYLEGMADPRLCVIWGKNMFVTYPWKYRRNIRPAREKGAKMVYIGPNFNSTAAKADEWIPIRPGTDPALALGMINVILSEGLHDESFLNKHTNGPFLVRNDNGFFLRERHLSSGNKSGRYIIWDTRTNKPQPYDKQGVAPALMGSYKVDGIECKTVLQLLAELAEQYPLEKVSEITDVAPDVIRRLALDHVNRRPVYTERGMAIQRQFYGDLVYRAIATLAAVTSNICLDQHEIQCLEGLNLEPFITPGDRIYKIMSGFQFYHNHLTESPYPIKAFWVSGMNPLNSHPNTNLLKELFSHFELIVVVELFMSATAEYADILLPGCTLFESNNIAERYSVLWTGSQPYFQWQPKLIEPLYESKSDFEIFNELAQRMGLGEFFDKSVEEYIEMLLSSGHPSMEGITLEKLKEGPMRPKPAPMETVTTTAGGLYQDEVSKGGSQFHTSSGRLEIYSEMMKEFGQELPVFIEPLESPRQPLAQKYPLSFLMGHSKAHFHSVVTDIDLLRELDPEPVLDMNSIDAEKRGIQDGDIVIAFNDRGRVKLKARINEGIRPGCVLTHEGWQPKHFTEGSYQELSRTTTNPAQEAVFESQGQMLDILVEVKKA